MSDIVSIPINQLRLDKNNPRISEFGLAANASQEAILEILWDEMDVGELLFSIVSNGYWDYEPLTVLKPESDEGPYVVLEGNRRLSAVLLIHKLAGAGIKIPKHVAERIRENPKLLDSTKSLPAVIVKDRKEAWRFIGFKHVNGPAKWGSFGKAKYIAEIHNTHGISLDDIAYQIGDTNKTVQRLYQGLMVLEQAYRVNAYTEGDIQTRRIYFSHLYTGLQREGIKNYIELADVEDESANPVPEHKHDELGQLLEWLYGSKRNGTQPIIRSQNPDLKNLDEVLQSRQATVALTRGQSLDYALELSRPSDALFEESLLSAKRNLQKARGYLTTGYNGDEQLLRVAGSVANLADDLYDEMDKARNEKFARPKKSRLTE